jgi:hypothetical protein
MVNWTVTVNKPTYLSKNTFLVPKDHIATLVTELLSRDDWFESDSITIEPSNMEYFDGRPEL